MVLVVPKVEIPDQFIGTVLMESLMEKYEDGAGIERVINVPRGYRLQFTKRWATAHPDDAILALAANVLIGGEPLVKQP